jgi:transposase-like protein
MKEQMTFFREELKNHSVVYTENLDSMRKEHKELTSSVRQLNDTLIKLQATMEFIPKK